MPVSYDFSLEYVEESKILRSSSVFLLSIHLAIEMVYSINLLNLYWRNPSMLKNQLKKLATLTGLLSLSLSVVAVGAGNTDTKPASSSINIKTSLVLTKTADLSFPDAYQSDAAAVLPATAGTAAAFSVVGNAGAQFLVDFPLATITMLTGAGDTADKQIVVDTFTTNLAANTGTLAGGSATFKVGASRAAIRPTQVIADGYTASFNVRVTYL